MCKTFGEYNVNSKYAKWLGVVKDKEKERERARMNSNHIPSHYFLLMQYI